MKRPAIAMQGRVIVMAFLGMAMLWAITSLTIGASQGALVLLGAALGITLYHASLGLAGGWRRLIEDRRGAGFRAQMLMVAVATLAMMSLLAWGPQIGFARAGAFAPVGVSVAVGDALFGAGMQLAGGCASGTLFTVGGGSRRMIIVLVAFCLGALVGAAHLPWWLGHYIYGTGVLWQDFGVPGATLGTVAILAALAGLTLWPIAAAMAGSRLALVSAASCAAPGPWLRALSCSLCSIWRPSRWRGTLGP